MSAVRTVKRFVAGALTSDPMTAVLKPLTRGAASVFMMHRFEDRERGNAGHRIDVLRSHLAYLRRKRYELVSLGELLRRLEERDAKRLARTVVFTIDDGYADYATAGAPAFEEFDCPATVFVVTGVVDDGGWYWWDRLRVLLESAQRRVIDIEVGGVPVSLSWANGEAPRAARALIDRLKLVPDDERRRVLASISALVDGDVSPTPPPQYAAMTWDAIRACGRRLTTFGAHTVTHPILGRTTDAVSASEIETSWRRLSAETDATVPVFCYPNGGPTDFGGREVRTLREIGIRGGVSSQPGYSTVPAFHGDADARFSMPRFPYWGDITELVQVVSGIERLKLAVRGAGAITRVDA